ncbi:MAG: MarR family transcriptional regulator [Bryobacteraceae bacterium]|nr:MarR family transcriptional regulator [Bryobacteraceae bacterium]
MLNPDSLFELFDETTALFHHLKAAAEKTHRQGELSAARRGVMRSLRKHGPLTVPQLARLRPVSRQHIQTIVDPLVKDGLASVETNPRHKRSKLIALTRKGARVLEGMDRRERRLLESTPFTISETAVRQATRVLRQVRDQLYAQHP